MKRFICAIMGCMLLYGFSALGETKDSDRKWLEVVQKMVTAGEKKVSTPDENRANLLKEWGVKNGYTVTVNKTEKGYSLEVAKDNSKSLVQN